MKLIKEVVYESFSSPFATDDARQFINSEQVKSIRDKDYDFDYYFEFFETDRAIVFANVYNLRDSEGSSIFQIETATVDKLSKKLIKHVDNDGYTPIDALNNLPIWTMGDFNKIGVSDGGDMYRGYEHQSLRWN